MRSTAPTMLPEAAATARPERATTVRPGATRRAHLSPAPLPTDQGLVLERYRLLAPLGTGAFATVYRALDERLAREVALKLIPNKRLIRSRFEREAWAAARLSHPAIVTLYEAASDESAAYLVSELVAGTTLEQALEEGRLSDRAILTAGISLCDALGYAHGQRIIHRDVKPSNILIPDSAFPPVKLTDFGVAHAIGGDSLTRTGDVIGTAAYMAPEQAAGREVRPSADLYALALVLYEALTGVNPLGSIATGHRTRLGVYLPPLRRQRRELPRELGSGIDLALRPRPAERGTIPELRAALEASLSAVSDRAGVVGEPWRPSALRATLARKTGAHSRGQTDNGFRLGSGGIGPMAAPSAAPAGNRSPVPAAKPPPAPAAKPPPALAARAAHAAAGGLLAGWVAAHVLGHAPLAPAATALAAAGLMLLVPRLGFLLTVGALALVAVVQGHAGDALVIAFGAALAIALAPRGRPLWAISVGAPLLGMIGLAGAWPALAARWGTARGRAVLGATGWLWLALASRFAGHALYVQVSGGPPHSLWSGSPYEAMNHVLGTLISSGALAPAPVWALGAAALPLLVRRKSPTLDLLSVTAWAASLVLFTELAISLLNSSAAPATVHTALLGAIAASAVAIAPTALAAARTARRGYTELEVP